MASIWASFKAGLVNCRRSSSGSRKMGGLWPKVTNRWFQHVSTHPKIWVIGGIRIVYIYTHTLWEFTIAIKITTFNGKSSMFMSVLDCQLVDIVYTYTEHLIYMCVSRMMVSVPRAKSQCRTPRTHHLAVFLGCSSTNLSGSSWANWNDWNTWW